VSTNSFPSNPRGTTRFAREKIATKYAALEREWYRKLQESGFVDIEPYDNPMNTRLVGHWHSTMQQTKRGVLSGGAEMYRLLYEWIDKTRFANRTDRWILAARCEGFDWAEIAERFAHVTRAQDAKIRCNRHIRAMLREHGLARRPK
jgi:hypothetical protein